MMRPRDFASARLMAPLLGALLLQGCAAPELGPASAHEQELAMQARAMQRTVLEATASGAALGALAGYLLGEELFDDRLTGAVVGAGVGGLAGAAAGNYVAFLQEQYATKEDALERLRADIEATNADTEATIRTMRVVVAEQRRALAESRRSGSAEAVAVEQQDAQRNLQNMQAAIGGAEGRLMEFQSTRSLQLAPGQATGVDRQINELSRRIAEMRSIAGTLAEDI